MLVIELYFCFKLAIFIVIKFYYIICAWSKTKVQPLASNCTIAKNKIFTNDVASEK
jgi:hypothetical protein